jgi:hypothetical protein
MIDLDGEIRALLEEQARGTPPLPAAAPTLRRTRRRQVTVALAGLATMVTIVVVSVSGVSALVRSSERQMPIGPDETPTIVAPYTCPPGSTPDLPGPVAQARPGKDAYVYGSTAFDRATGRAILLTTEGKVWAFDVCSNTWESGPDGIGGLIGGLADLVYDADSGRMIAIHREQGALRVWVYDSAERTWSRRGRLPIDEVPNGMFSEKPQAVYDTASDLVVVRDQFSSSMWTYDVGTDTWAELEQGSILPPPVEGQEPPWELLTYDASVDRPILYVSDSAGQHTWDFDIGNERWSEKVTATPEAGFGWFVGGDEFVYDEAHEVSVLLGGGTTATYAASEARWSVVSGGHGTGIAPDGQMTRLYFAMTYDSVNGRVLVAGGDHRTGSRWQPADDVMAFDVSSGTWIPLLAPRSE